MRIMLDHTLLHRGNLLLVNAQHPLKDRTIDDLPFSHPISQAFACVGKQRFRYGVS